MVIITQYEIICKRKFKNLVKSNEVHICPVCGGRLGVKDYRLRSVIKNGETSPRWYKLRRLQCCQCHRLHLELPDFMVPFKRHESASVQEVLDGKPTACCAEESTMLRWKKAFAARALQTEMALRLLLSKVRGKYRPLLNETSLLTQLRKNNFHWLSLVTRLLLAAGFGPPT